MPHSSLKEEIRITVRTEETNSTEHGKAGLDFAKAASQNSFTGSQILNACVSPASQPLCATDL